ncbi:MAG: hypothetical protein ABFC24_13360, partial [Methanoregulaceae archaeon]
LRSRVIFLFVSGRRDEHANSARRRASHVTTETFRKRSWLLGKFQRIIARECGRARPSLRPSAKQKPVRDLADSCFTLGRDILILLLQVRSQ